MLILSGLAAHLNILPIAALTGYLRDTFAADRYAYLSSAGLAWLTAAASEPLLRSCRPAEGVRGNILLAAADWPSLRSATRTVA